MWNPLRDRRERALRRTTTEPSPASWRTRYTLTVTVRDDDMDPYELLRDVAFELQEESGHEVTLTVEPGDMPAAVDLGDGGYEVKS